MDLGTRKSFIRFAAEYEAKNLMGTLLGSTIFLRFLGSIVIISITILFLNPLFSQIWNMEKVFDLVILTCLAAFTQSMCYTILAYYRARHEGIKFMGSSLVIIIILTIMSAIFLVPMKMGVEGVLYAQIITYGASWILLSLRIFLTIGIGVSQQIVKQLFVFGFPLIFLMSGYLIMDTSALYLLSYFRDLEEVGIYSLGYKLAQITVIILIVPFQLAYEPFVYSNMNKSDIRVTIARLFTYLMMLFTLMAIVIVFIFRDLLSIIAPIEYKDAYLIIFLVLPGLAFKGGHNIAQTLLLMKDKSKTAGMIITIFTVINILLHYLLIPHFGLYGVVIVTNFTFISIMIVMMTLGRRSIPIPLETRRLFITAIVFFGFLAFIFFLSNQSSYIYYTVVPLILFFSLIAIFTSQFLSSNEKIFIKSMYQRLAATLLS
jgi:O-antigen/teichoic acid export membrane protein